MKFIDFLKKIPVDLGQANLKYTTKGKLIGLKLIPANGRRALDVGCRDGYFSEYLKEKGYDVQSIDINCRYKKCHEVDVNEELPYENNYFDLIWCSEVIEHLKTPEKSIEEFRRVLKPEGIGIFTTPNSKFWLYKILKLFGKNPKDVQNKTHLHFFGIDQIQKFRPEKIYGYFPYIILKFRIERLINLLSPTFIFIIKKRT